MVSMKVVSMKAYLTVSLGLLAITALTGCQDGRASLPGLIDTISEQFSSRRPTSVVGPQQPAQPSQQQAQQQPHQQSTPPQQGAAPLPAPATAPVEARPLEPPVVMAPGSGAAPGSGMMPGSGLAPGLVPPSQAEAVRVGFLAPLSGPSAALGRALLDAAQMALFDLNDERVLLLPRDTEGQPEAAMRAAQALLSEGVDILIGPLFSASAAAVAPLARERGVKVLTFSTDRNVAGNGVYTLGFTPDQQVARVLAYGRSRGYVRYALLAPNSPYGEAVAQEAVSSLTGSLMVQERYPADSPDLTPSVRRFAAALRALPPRPGSPEDASARPAIAGALGNQGPQPNPVQTGGQTAGQAATQASETVMHPPVDAILLPEGGARLRALAPLLPYFDIDPRHIRLLGTGLWDDPSLGNEPALLGGWFAAPQPEGFEEFRKRFEQSYGRRPPRLASLAYDATALAGILARQQPGPAAQSGPAIQSGPATQSSQVFADAALNNPDGFAGYDGIFRFRPDGVVERGLAILEIQRRGMRVIDPAPSGFNPPVN